jgi:hypothetical protein
MKTKIAFAIIAAVCLLSSPADAAITISAKIGADRYH